MDEHFVSGWGYVVYVCLLFVYPVLLLGVSFLYLLHMKEIYWSHRVVGLLVDPLHFTLSGE